MDYCIYCFTFFLMLYFPLLNHPLSMALNLFLQTFLVSWLLSSMTSSGWLGYIFFLVFLGGLLILFAYISTLASNEKFSLDIKVLSFLFLGALLFCLVNGSSKATFFSNQDFLLNEVVQSSMFDLYLYDYSLTLFLVGYLLLCLLVVVRLCQLSDGPLRSS